MRRQVRREALTAKHSAVLEKDQLKQLEAAQGMAATLVQSADAGWLHACRNILEGMASFDPDALPGTAVDESSVILLTPPFFIPIETPNGGWVGLGWVGLGGGKMTVSSTAAPRAAERAGLRRSHPDLFVSLAPEHNVRTHQLTQNNQGGVLNMSSG